MSTHDEEIIGHRRLLSAILMSAVEDAGGSYNASHRRSAMHWLQSDTGRGLMVLMDVDPDAAMAQIRPKFEHLEAQGGEDVA